MSEMLAHPVQKIRTVKPDVVIVGGGAVAALGYIMYRRRQSSSTAVTPIVTDDGTNDSTDITDQGTDSDYSTADYDSGYSAAPASALTSYSDPSSDTTIAGAENIDVSMLTPSTNPQWVQQGVGYLSNEGYDAATVGAALSAYVLGMGLTPGQLTIVETAIGTEGTPPKPVPAPHLLPHPGQSTTGGTTKATTTVPTRTGVRSLSAPGIRESKTRQGTFIVVTRKPKGATNYVLFKDGNKVNEHADGKFQITPGHNRYHVDATAGNITSASSNFVTA